jgi:hypothetical protein
VEGYEGGEEHSGEEWFDAVCCGTVSSARTPNKEAEAVGVQKVTRKSSMSSRVELRHAQS